MSLLSLLAFVSRHPLNQGSRARACGRVLRWQIASRFGPGAVAVPFIDSTRLLVTPGMTGATGNWYCGLHEANDMGFVLHYLRSSDTFWDIGANIGSYTILAAGAAGARAVAIEPIPSTFAILRANIRLNDLDDKVLLINGGLAAEPGTLRFTGDLDTMNHALGPGETNACEISVNVTTLDTLARDTPATFIKIDVEGFESAVLEGGR